MCGTNVVNFSVAVADYANERLLLYAENELLLITMQVGALAMQVVNVESGRARIVSKQGMVVIKDCVSASV